MADKILSLDISGLVAKLGQLDEGVQTKLNLAAKGLAIQAHAHIAEQANEKLHTRAEMFKEGLDWSQLDEGVYAVTIDGSVRWIEDGMEQHEMLEALLASPKAKTSKKGTRYITIPFKHSKGPTQQNPVEKQLLKSIKAELKKRNIPYMKIEKNPDGSPKEGRLHAFDLATPGIQGPMQPGETGPQGKGFSIFPRPQHKEGPSGRPYLWGVRVYQNKGPGGDIQRGIFTFRTASDSQKGSGKWVHPGTPPMNFMDDAFDWAKQEWDTKIMPELLASLGL